MKTPNLDRLARGGVNFFRARSPVPLTLPSHASILTGNYPPSHTARDNATYIVPETQLTLAEVLRSRGYSTAAFVGSFVLDSRFGLAQGFDLYDDRLASEVAALESFDAERSAGAVFSAFEHWLGDRDRSRPFFSWVHFYDPHAPFVPPEPYLSRHRSDPYAGEIAYVDEVVGRIITKLESDDLLDTTILAVVGDHGEGLGEHREATHSVLIYNSTLHVPMMIHAPGLIPSGARIDQLVRTIDLAPTLLDYLGPAAQLGEGLSLRSRIDDAVAGRGDPKAEDAVSAYSESLYPRLNLGWSELMGLESGRYHFILAPEPELYDVVLDPGETHNLAASQPEAFRQLRRELFELSEAFPKPAENAGQSLLDPEAEAKLRSLGYVSGSHSRGRPSRSEPAIDPKSKMEVWNQIQRGLYEYSVQNHEVAAAILEGVLAVEKDMPLLYELLGSCFMRLEQTESAEGVFRQALDRGFESASLHIELGRILFGRQQYGLAERELREALSLQEYSVPAHFHLAQLLRATRRSGEALGHYRRALELNPDYVYAWNGLATALAVAGEGEEALGAFRMVVEVAPLGPRGYFNLAVHLERMGRVTEAIAIYDRFVELVKSDPELAGERARAMALGLRLKAKEH